MKKYLLLATFGTVLAASGCAGLDGRLDKAKADLEKIAETASGPCGQKAIAAVSAIAEASAACQAAMK